VSIGEDTVRALGPLCLGMGRGRGRGALPSPSSFFDEFPEPLLISAVKDEIDVFVVVVCALLVKDDIVEVSKAGFGGILGVWIDDTPAAG
jgi:hypothetical protein